MSESIAAMSAESTAEKRLLLLTSSYPATARDGRAAAGFFVRDFSEELAKKCQLVVLTQHTGIGEKEISGNGYTVFRFSWPGRGKPLSTLKLPRDIIHILSILARGMISTIRYTRHSQAQHVIALWAIPSGLWALVNKLLTGTPYTIWCLGSDIWNYRNSRLVKPLLSIILRNAASVYADGFELKDEVNRIADVSCSYLPSARKFSFPAQRKKLLPSGKRHYLFVGRYHLHKGPDILVDAIRLLPETLRQEMYFHLYGGGPMRAQLESMITSSDLADCISLGDFIGEAELVDSLASADAVIIPSREETISLMLSAALQANKPIIASDVGDMGYVLKKYEAGQAVRVESVEDLANAIRADFLGKNDFSEGRERLLATLDLSTSAREILRSAGP